MQLINILTATAYHLRLTKRAYARRRIVIRPNASSYKKQKTHSILKFEKGVWQFECKLINIVWRCSALRVSMLDSRSSGPGSGPGGRHFLLWKPLSIQVWPCDGLASHPGGSRNISGCFTLQKPAAWWATWFICRPYLSTLLTLYSLTVTYTFYSDFTRQRETP